MNTPMLPPQEIYIVTLANGLKIPVDPAAFEEVLKADRRDTGELVAVSPFDYISTRYIVSAFKKIIVPQATPVAPAEAPAPEVQAEVPAPTPEVPPTETPVDISVA